MKLPNFKTTAKNFDSIPPWMDEMEEGDSISCYYGFTMGGYWDTFDLYTFPSEEKGDIRYYVYDPVKHGAPTDQQYPVLMWIHGLNCSLDGIKCVGYSGAELFASPEYQKAMGGGAYIIVPLANETRLEDNTIEGSWDEAYLPYLKAIYDKVVAEHAANIGWKFIMGASSGGYVSWRMLELYGDYFQGAIPCASGYVPDIASLQAIDAAGIQVMVAHSRHDELVSFEERIVPIEDVINSLPHFLGFFPEWIRNKDKGVASINYGLEMGQHCIINPIQGNLMYDDGTCYDKRLPLGVTGWIREVCQ